MKKVIEDKHFESITLSEIEKTREVVQTVLDRWNELKYQTIASPSELYDLISNPEILVREAVMSRKTADGADVPGSIPSDPLSLYAAAKAAKRLPFAAREQGLFSVRGKKVVTIDAAAETLANARSIYAYNERQEKFASDVVTFADTFNLINAKMRGRLLSVPTFRTAWGVLFNLPPEGYEAETDKYPASFKLERLKEIINQIA